jgi:hypothetical protein
MELRFLKGNWGFGKFKLQLKESDMEGWVDVPMIDLQSQESEVKPENMPGFIMPYKECNHCGGDIAIRNPKGFCDHLYYPENCKVCSKPKTTESKKQEGVWCEHTRHESHWFEGWLVSNGHGYYGKDWMFCPICGTPRPKELSLAEKFKKKIESCRNDYNLADYLVLIAEEHFKSKGGV